MHATSCNPSTSTTRTPSASTTRNIPIPDVLVSTQLHCCTGVIVNACTDSPSPDTTKTPRQPPISEGLPGRRGVPGVLVLDGCQVSTQLCKRRTRHVQGSMLVGPSGHDRRVPQNLRDHLSVDPERQQQGRGRVPGVMATDAWHAGVSK